MAIIIKMALMASLSIILLTVSTTPMVKPIYVFGEADDSVNAAAQVYISDDNSDNDEKTTMKRRKQAGLILNMLVMQTITRWWITKTSLA